MPRRRMKLSIKSQGCCTELLEITQRASSVPPKRLIKASLYLNGDGKKKFQTLKCASRSLLINCTFVHNPRNLRRSSHTEIIRCC